MYSNPFFIIIAIFLLFLLVDNIIKYIRKKKFLKFLYRYAFATKRPSSNVFFRSEDKTKRFFYSKWGEDNLKETIEELKNDDMFPEDFLLEGLRRILPNQPRINYVQFDKLTKLFENLYNSDSPKSKDYYYGEYNEYKLLPTIKTNRLFHEKELLSEYFWEIPNEFEIKEILKSLNKDNIIDDVEDFWFVVNKDMIYDTFNWEKIILGGVDLMKKLI